MTQLAEIEADPAAQAAKTYLLRAAWLESVCRVVDVATAVSGLGLMVACLLGHPLWGLIPFGLCAATTAVATRQKSEYRARATAATLQVQISHPHIDDGCGCG